MKYECCDICGIPIVSGPDIRITLPPDKNYESKELRLCRACASDIQRIVDRLRNERGGCRVGGSK